MSSPGPEGSQAGAPSSPCCIRNEAGVTQRHRDLPTWLFANLDTSVSPPVSTGSQVEGTQDRLTDTLSLPRQAARGDGNKGSDSSVGKTHPGRWCRKMHSMGGRAQITSVQEFMEVRSGLDLWGECGYGWVS